MIEVRSKAIRNGCSLRTNVTLLTVATVFAAISSFSDTETLRIAFLVAGWLLTLAAVVPASFGSVWECVSKGKGRYVDPNTIVPGWRQFCQSMGIEEDIKVKVFPNLRNAYADRTTTKIKIGQPVLDSLDPVSTKAVAAHELAHFKGDIKGDYDLWQKCLLFGVWFGALLTAAVLLCRVSYSFGPPSSHLFWFAVLLVLVDFAGIAIRFISWPREYEADLTAEQYAGRKAVISFLKAMAELRKVDVTRDFYSHPSINKRIANLSWSEKTRFKKWHLEL